MAIESAVIMRRVARIACMVLLASFVFGGRASAQLPITFRPGNPPPVTAGSVIPFNHGSTGAWSQIYSMKMDPLHGNVLFLDSALSELFVLAPNSNTPTLIASPAPQTGNSDCSDLEKSGSYWNAAIAFDKWDNLYVTDRYGSAVQFCRVPYSGGTWTFSAAAHWSGPTYKNSSGNQVPIPPQDLQVGDDGVTFYVSTASTKSIFKYTVDQNGNVSNVTALATGLEDMVSNMAVDHAGNLYFLENVYDSLSARVPGILEIPAGSQTVVGGGDGKAEALLPRIDQGGYNGIKGISFDAQGNLYFNSENNSSFGGAVDGVFMIPNEGTPANPNLVWADTIMVAPVGSGFPVLVDPRGLLWIATGGSSNWAPPGTNAPSCDTSTQKTAAATCLASSIVLWQPGSANLGASTVGGAQATNVTSYSVGSDGSTITLTANNSLTENQIVTVTAAPGDALAPLSGLSFYVSGSGLSASSFQISSSLIAAGASGSTSATATPNQTQTLYFMFNRPETVAKFSLSQPSGSNFTRVTKNPVANATATAPVPVCTDGGSYPGFSANETTTSAYSYCTYYVQLNTPKPGLVQGEVQLLDSNSEVLEGSNAFVSGIGQGAAISVASSATVTSIASGLNDPMQVAADLRGNTYVADSALKAIEMYPAGTATPTSGTLILSGLSDPTGVAVDGTGDVYVGDSGKVIEIPFVNGALAPAQQATLASGLGTGNLSVAADGAGDIFVADKQKAQVIEVPNPQTTLMLDGLPFPVLGGTAGFTGPSAIATDSYGNVWVADGANLWKIDMPFGTADEVLTGALQPPVTGLAVDPSGSVFVAGASGIVWIPYNTTTGTLNINGAVTVATGLGSGTTPALASGLALDGSQNLYATYGSGASAGLAQLGISGSFNFSSYGEINPNVPFEVDAQILNLGNEPLMLASLAGDLVSGAGASDYSVQPASLNVPACGPSTSTPPGGSCYLGLVLQAPSAGAVTAAVNVLSNAANASGGVNISMTGNVVQDLRPGTQLTIAPISAVTYPGSVTIQVKVVSSDSRFGTPTGSVVLYVGSPNGNLPQQSVRLDANGFATFNYTNLMGGAYNVRADYGGDGVAGTDQNTCSGGSLCFAGSASKAQFTVNQAIPAFLVGPPVTDPTCLNWTSSNCQPNAKFVTSWAGNTYVQVSNPVWIMASVTSKVGTPSGTVTYLLNGKPVDLSQGVDGAIPLNGNGIAKFSLQGLSTGMYTLSAAYSGDVNYAAQSTNLGSFYVIVPSVQVTQTNPGTVNVTPGTPVQVSLTLMPLVGFSSSANPVALECNAPDAPVQIPGSSSTVLPQYAQCTFAYANTVTGTSPVGVDGTTPTTIVVTISTNVPTNGGTSSGVKRSMPWDLAGIFGIGLAGLIAGRKRLNRYLILVCAAASLSAAFAGLTSCTNASYSTPPPAPKVKTPSGTYNVQIITYNPSSLKQNSLTTPVFTLPVTVQ